MNDNNGFKNILMISNYSMFEHSPLGITLRSIFKEWPDSQLFELYRYQTEKLNHKDIKIKSYKLPAKFLPLDNLIRKVSKKNIKYTNSETTFQVSEYDSVSIKQKIKSTIKYLSESMFVPNKGSEINRSLNQFKPQVIYTIGESLFALKASLYFSKKYNIPIVVHYMDNWRETLYPSKGNYKILSLLFLRNLKRVESRMKNGLVISPKMKEHYALINQNVKYNVLLNSVSGVESISQNNHNGNEIIFTYVGGLHLNRWKSMLNVENCIYELNRKGIPSKLYIYTPEADKAQFSNKFNKNLTLFKGHLPHDKIHLAYNTASILLHVESFDKKVIQYTKYSLSTKIPECMSVGKPILCYAPTDIAVSEYINKTNSGIAVGNYNDLLEASKELACNKKLRAELGENGILTVKREHTYEKAHEILLNTL
ncbi:glycosyltransferase [Bacillaceae bacterium S4-13-58]